MPFINNNKKNLYNLENHKPGDVKYFSRIYDQYLPGLYTQVGSTCDRYGSVVAMSEDGYTIAVGAPYYSDTSDEGTLFRTRLCGMVKIYKFDGNKWNLKGQPIVGPRKDYMLGISIDMNNSGTKIIIGSAALEYGPSRYIDYVSSPRVSSQSKETYDDSKDIYDGVKSGIGAVNIGIEAGRSIDSVKAGAKGGAAAGVGIIANIAIDEITKGKLDKEPDILLSIQQNPYFEEGLSPEGNGYPDLNIMGRGNVRIYEWLEGEWNNTLSFDGSQYDIAENFGSSVAIASYFGEIIAIGSPRFSISERYRERKAVEDWVIFLKVLQTVGNYVLTVAGGGAGLLVYTIEMTVDSVMKSIEDSKKVSNLFLQREKDIYFSGDHYNDQHLDFFDPAPYRTNHTVYRNMGQIMVYNIRNRKNYTIKTPKTENYNKDPSSSVISASDAFIIKERKKLANVKEKNKHIGDRIGDSFYGESIALSGDGKKIVTFNRNDNTINTSVNLTYFADPIFISYDYDTSKVVLAISGDGSKLAVGLPNTWRNVGVVLLYIWHEVDKGWRRSSTNDDATAGGILLRGVYEEGVGDKFGNSVSLNRDGTILAVGSPFSLGPTPADTNSGNVKVYKWDPLLESWGMYGSNIIGTKDNLLGTSIKLSGNGKTIVIGVPCKHINSDYGLYKVNIYTENKRTLKYTYNYPPNMHPLIQQIIEKKSEKAPNVTTNSSSVLSTDTNDYSDTKIPFDNFTDDSIGIEPIIYGDPISEPNSTSFVDLISKYYKCCTKTVKKRYNLQIDGYTQEVTEWMIYEDIIKKRRTLIPCDEGQYGFVKVFKFINEDWNQNCIDSNESTDIRAVPLIPPDVPLTGSEMSGMKIVNLYVDTEYVDPGINMPSGYTLSETISDINSKVVGYYNISYLIKNRRGHVTRFDRDVNVIRRPTINNTTPVIVLKGDEFNENAIYDLWLEGQVDEVISNTIDVNTSLIGDYSITYNVSITKNIYKSEIIELKRDVKVIPKKIITITGGTQVVRQFNKYKDLGATIKDTDNNILSSNLISTSIPFSTEVLGTYYVTYSAEYTPAITRRVIVTSPYVKSMQSLLKDISLSV
jgi:hypothetical protein